MRTLLKTGSLKSKLAVSGIRQKTKFCIENQISNDICGKILVTSNSSKELFLDNFAERLAKIA